MRLYLIRHGVAEPRRSDLPDATRALTEKGRARMQREVKALKRLGMSFDTLWYSPLVRATETATLLEKRVRGESKETPLLAKPPSKQLLELLVGADVALVGHEPYLSELLSLLCFGEAGGTRARVPLKKGGVAMLEGTPEPGGMELRMLLPPKLLRQL